MGFRATMPDETGNIYGRLTIVRHSPVAVFDYWQCRCECGEVVNVRGERLRRGRAEGCGCGKACINLRHGHAKSTDTSPTYRSYQSMKARCLRPSHHVFSLYGGRGISICERWLESFENFLADMGERPAGKSIDRIDNDGNYEPGNCRWATQKEQCRNCRHNHVIEFQGVRMTLTQWSHETGIKQTTIRSRIRNGWSVERALTTPPQTGF